MPTNPQDLTEKQQKVEEVAFLAGCVYNRMPDEDALIMLDAFKEWKQQQKGKV